MPKHFLHLLSFNKLKNQKYFNHFIIGFTLFTISLIIYTIVHIYSLTLEETRNRHQEKQLEIAKSAASGITNYLNYLHHELAFFSKGNFTNESFIQFYNSKEKKGILKSIFRTDSLGNILFNFGIPISNTKRIRIKQETSRFNENYNEVSFYSDVYPGNIENNHDSLYFFLMVKKSLNQKSESNYLGYIISCDWLIKNFVEPLKLNENDFAWILDNKGRLIYHPNHSEMLFRSINEYENDCYECHVSFDVQKNMLLKKNSVDEYYILGEPKKIMAYAQIELNNNFWILAVSTYLPSVVEGVRDNFIIFFILSGIAIIFTITMGVLIYTINVKRVKALESEKFLEQSRSFQEKINHAAKLASIGELVDNVAHEINTPTGIISAETDTLILKDCNPKNCCEELNIIKDQTRRIRDYTRSLLNYSRRMPFLPELNDILEVLDECLFLLSPRIRANQIKIVKHIEPNIPKFIFDKGRIEQVIINILNNAIDSVRENREITVSIKLRGELHGNCPGNYLEISINDKGIGIAQENIEKIFEPFYSTKSTEKGTGLGLSISNAIVKRHNGNILVESEVNKGTTFCINLPMTNDKLNQ